MMKWMMALAAAPAVALAACSGDEPAAPEPAPEPDPVAIEAGAFADLDLGIKVAGPEGETVTSEFGGTAGPAASAQSYVACPKGTPDCNPATLPMGTIFTYVYTVTPTSDLGSDSVIGMTEPAHGFTGTAGFDQAQAKGALGEGAEVVVACHGERLMWTVGGAAGWPAGKPITLFWQSRLAPEGPKEVFRLTSGDAETTGKAPFPKAASWAFNACE